MGVLFRRTDEEPDRFYDYKNAKDDDSIFQDAITKIKEIINSSDFEKESRETRTIGFEMDIIKTKYDLILQKCNSYNKFSKTKSLFLFNLV